MSPRPHPQSSELVSANEDEFIAAPAAGSGGGLDSHDRRLIEAPWQDASEIDAPLIAHLGRFIVARVEGKGGRRAGPTFPSAHPVVVSCLRR